MPLHSNSFSNERIIARLAVGLYDHYTFILGGKIYLSVILDLCDKRPVAYANSDRNDNSLVLTTFEKAIKRNPKASPIFHSDRGCQYTSKEFRKKIVTAGMTRSMSRVAHCIDNGPMEGFWGIMKRKMYYRHQFRTKEELLIMIEGYMTCYSTKRVQRNLKIIPLMEYHEMISPLGVRQI